MLASLKDVLSDFPLFAGRLSHRDEKLLIDCNNKGLLFYTVQDSSSLAQVIDQLSKISKKRLVEPINAKKAIADSTAVMAIKLTYFACGGMSLGVCWHHALGDMDTFMGFMKAWSSVTGQQPYEPPLIVENRADYLKEKLADNGIDASGFRKLSNQELLKLTSHIILRGRDKASVRVYFSDHELAHMKRSLSAKANRQLSTNDALCAHLFSQISALDSPERAGCLSIVVGHRARTALPPNLLGNYYSILHLPTPPQVDPVRLAIATRESLDDFARSHLDYYANQRYVENNGGIANLARFIVKSIDLSKRALLITNWSGFNMYELTFGKAELLYFTPFGDTPLPWLSSLVKGIGNQGLVYSAVLPKKLAQKVSHPDNLAKFHQYRDKAKTLPTNVSTLSWLL